MGRASAVPHAGATVEGSRRLWVVILTATPVQTCPSPPRCAAPFTGSGLGDSMGNRGRACATKEPLRVATWRGAAARPHPTPNRELLQTASPTWALQTTPKTLVSLGDSRPLPNANCGAGIATYPWPDPFRPGPPGKSLHNRRHEHPAPAAIVAPGPGTGSRVKSPAQQRSPDSVNDLSSPPATWFTQRGERFVSARGVGLQTTAEPIGSMILTGWLSPMTIDGMSTVYEPL